MIIIVGGIKGGTGKTTIATNLAVIGSLEYKNVLLVDCDEQESTFDWAEQRAEFARNNAKDEIYISLAEFPIVKLSGKYVFDQLLRFRKKYECIIVDTGGRDTTSQRSALLAGNYYIVPVKPRSLDVWTLGKVKDLIDQVRTLNKSLKIVMCINQADPTGGDNEDTRQIIEEMGDYKIAHKYIGHRKIFANAASIGLTVPEMKKNDAKAYEEIYSLYYEIYPKDV